MRIALHSDLHLEGNRLPLNFLADDSYDVLVLAGDIVSARTQMRLCAIKEAAGSKPIIYIPGNHEYYGGSFEEVEASLKNICESVGIIYANNSIVRLDGKVSFVCSTGWSTLESFPEFDDTEKRTDVSFGIGDFRLIEGFDIDTMTALGRRDKKFLETSLRVVKDEFPNDIVVVVTHFAPTEAHGNARFDVGTLSSYFSNNWEDVMYEHQPDYWFYGHTHGSVERDVYHTKVCCNQRGYGLECRSTYDPKRVITATKQKGNHHEYVELV